MVYPIWLLPLAKKMGLRCSVGPKHFKIVKGTEI
jgi:hypothetical protein